MAIPGGIDDGLVASDVADVKEADMNYSFLAGKRRTQEMDEWARGHLSIVEDQHWYFLTVTSTRRGGS